MSTCKSCESEMRWPLCTKFQPGTFKKDKCAECFHTAGDHGGGGAPAEAKKEDAPRPRRTEEKKKEEPKEEPKPRRTYEEKPKEPEKKREVAKKKSPSPVRRAAAAPVAAVEEEEVKETMKCVVAQRGGGGLVVETRATPKPAKDEVLIRVKGAGLNQADLLQAEGKYPPPQGASDVLGLEVAGTIVKVGHAMKDYWGFGDRVCSLLSGGGYGEYCVVHGDSLIELPERMSMEEGAGVAEAFLTAYQALFFLSDLKNRVKDRKQNILIWGASGGVGSAAVQLARHFVGDNTRVFGVASTAEKCQYVKQLGAHVAINRKDDDLARVIERECDGKGIDILVDLVGAANFGTNLKIMAADSVMIMLGFLSGSQCSETELRDILAKRITIKGSTLRSRDNQYKGILTQSFVEDFGSLLERGTLKVEVDRKFDLESCNDAHKYMAEGRHKGKIIFTIPDSWSGSGGKSGAEKISNINSADDEEREKKAAVNRRERERQQQRRDEEEAAEKKKRKEEEAERANEREKREKIRLEEEKAAKKKEEDEKNKERDRRQKEREEKQRKEREEEEREKKEREKRVREREEKLAGSSSKLPSVSASGGGGSGEFKACKSDLVDDDKSPMTEKEFAWILEMVNSTLNSTKQFPKGLSSADALVKAFRDGILPCVHLGALCPKDIDTRAINAPVDDNRDREENFTLYLGAARGVGASFDRAITRQSLSEATKEQAFACLWQNIKCFHNVSIQREASIRASIASETGAKEADIRDEWPANKILAGWLSVVLKKRLKSVPFSDLPDLIPSVAQHALKSSCSNLGDATRNAAKVGIATIPEALSAGHGRVSFAFVGDLFQQATRK